MSQVPAGASVPPPVRPWILPSKAEAWQPTVLGIQEPQRLPGPEPAGGRAWVRSESLEPQPGPLHPQEGLQRKLGLLTMQQSPNFSPWKQDPGALPSSQDASFASPTSSGFGSGFGCSFGSGCRSVSWSLSSSPCSVSLPVSSGSFRSFCLFSTPSLRHPLHPQTNINISNSRPKGSDRHLPTPTGRAKRPETSREQLHSPAPFSASRSPPFCPLSYSIAHGLSDSPPGKVAKWARRQISGRPKPRAGHPPASTAA